MEKTETGESKIDPLKIIFIGEIVGKSGVYCIKKLLPRLKEETGAHFVIANGEGATGGYGIGKNHAIYLRKLGIDSITSGERIYYKKDMVDHIKKSPYILRPANYPYENPGRGWMVYTTEHGPIGVISILGQAGFPRVHLANPFTLLPDIVRRMSERTPVIIVDFHAAMSAEKNGMFFHMEGKVSAVIGTHTKVLTADEKILPGGTAVITDAGRTGSINSVGGLRPDIEIEQYLTQIPEYSKAAWDKLELQGVVISIDRETGKALDIQRLRIECEDPENE